MSTAALTELDICPADELTAEPLEWLLPGRLAYGKVAIFDGDPGLGKSLVALDLCARLSAARPLPDGTPIDQPAASIYLTAEDAAQDTILPRLQALQADLSRVFVLRRDSQLLDQPLTLPAHIEFLDRILTKTGAKLLVLDPIVAFLDASVLSGSDQSVRRALYPLAVLAEKHHCVIILIRHLNKKAGDCSLYRGAGSIGFLAACRSGWLFAREPLPRGLPLAGAPPAHAPGLLDHDLPRRCVIAQLKNNLAPAQPSLAYELIARAGSVPALNWLGPCAWTADQLLARPSKKPQPARYRARSFLKRFLAAGPRTTRDIWQAALDHDLNERTLHRARKDLAIESHYADHTGQRLCYWLLPDQKLPPNPAIEQDEGQLALEASLDELRRRYPSPTPLDDDERDDYCEPPRRRKAHTGKSSDTLP